MEEYHNGPPRTWRVVGELALQAAEDGDTEELEAALKIIGVLGQVPHTRSRKR